MPSDKDKIAELKDKTDNLERAIIETKLKGLKGQLVSMSDTLHQRITDSEEKRDMEFVHIKEGIDQVLVITQETFKQAKETNGRVTELEKQKLLKEKENELLTKKLDDTVKHTRVVRFLHKYPIITTLLVLGAYLFALPEVREHTVNGITKFFSLFGKIF